MWTRLQSSGSPKKFHRLNHRAAACALWCDKQSASFRRHDRSLAGAAAATPSCSCGWQIFVHSPPSSCCCPFPFSSSSSSVCPQVLFKMVLGSAKFGEAALFLSIVGSANFVFVSCVPIILYFTRVEYIGSLADIPWMYLCGVAGLLFGTNNYTTDRSQSQPIAITIS